MSATTDPAELVVGRQYTAQTTGTLRGRRIFRTITFTAGRALIEREFMTPRDGCPLEYRIMTRHYVRELRRYDNHPTLVVAGTIAELERGEHAEVVPVD